MARLLPRFHAVILLIISFLTFVSLAHANLEGQDPCNEIPGTWIGTANQYTGYQCSWNLTAYGSKYKNIVRLEIDFIPDDRREICKRTSFVFTGRCRDAVVDFGSYQGTVFRGLLTLDKWNPRYSIKLRKQ